MRVISQFTYVLLIGRSMEAGPAGAGLEFRLCIEEVNAANNTLIDTIIVVIPVLACESPLRSFVARHFVLNISELRTPLLFIDLDARFEPGRIGKRCAFGIAGAADRNERAHHNCR